MQLPVSLVLPFEVEGKYDAWKILHKEAIQSIEANITSKNQSIIQWPWKFQHSTLKIQNECHTAYSNRGKLGQQLKSRYNVKLDAPDVNFY